MSVFKTEQIEVGPSSFQIMEDYYSDPRHHEPHTSNSSLVNGLVSIDDSQLIVDIVDTAVEPNGQIVRRDVLNRIELPIK